MTRALLPDDAQPLTLAILFETKLPHDLPSITLTSSRTKALLVLLERLSPEEQQALQTLPHRIIGLEDNLLDIITTLQSENARLREMALIDNMTGLYNNRFFQIQLDTEMARTRRTGQPCCLLMMDLDNFKIINDTRGHIEGDRFLEQSAKAFSQAVRAVDIVCRYGGDEFAVILPATRTFVAMRIANRLRKSVEEIPGATGYGISLSIGIAEFTVSSPWTRDDFVQAADSAMYDAKSKGKNQISFRGRYVHYQREAQSVTPEEREAIFSMCGGTVSEGEKHGR